MAIWAAVGSLIQVNMKMMLADYVAEVTDYFRVAGNPIDDSDLGAFNGAMLTQRYNPVGGQNTLASKITDLMAPPSIFASAVAQPISSDPRPVPSVIYQGGELGRRGGDVLPPAASYLLRLRTFGPARSGQGRRFLPFFSETDQNAGTWQPAGPFDTGMQAICDRWIAGVSYTTPAGLPVQLQPVVASRRQGAVYLIYGVHKTTKVRTQRRRAGRLPSIVP